MAKGIKDKVAIIGMGCTRFGERWDCGPEELIVEAFTEALGDAKISAFFDRHLDDELKATADARSLDKRVIALVTPALSEGPPNIEDIARKLGMSRRTLQRRLASEQCAYVELVDRARRALSTDLLRTSNYSLAEIAFLSGYSDQSTFTRAFRRWVGETPADFRRRSISV